MDPRDTTALRHILEAIELIERYAGSSPYEAVRDRKTRDAIVFNLAVLGEATKTLSPELRTSTEDIEWRKIAGMRDRLIHGYYAINDRLVAEVVAREIPALKNRILAIPGFEP